MIDFLMVTIMCFLMMHADGSTTCQCVQVPVTQSKVVQRDVSVRKQSVRQPRSVLLR